MALRLAARSFQHFPRRHGAGALAARARLHPARAQPLRHVFLRQDHDRALLVRADVLSRRLARRLSLFSLHARAPAGQTRGLRGDARARPRRRRRGAAARDRKRRGQENLAGRDSLSLERRPGAGHPRGRRARFARRTRCDLGKSRRARHAGSPARAHAVRARAGGAPRGDSDAGAARRPRGEPASLARRRRGAAARAGGGGRFAPAAEREHRLPASGNLRQGQGHRGHRRRRLDRRGDLRSHRHLRGGAAFDRRELRAGAARGAGEFCRQGWARPDRGPHCRRARPRAHVPPDRRFQTGHGVPRSSTCRCSSAIGPRG